MIQHPGGVVVFCFVFFFLVQILVTHSETIVELNLFKIFINRVLLDREQSKKMPASP